MARGACGDVAGPRDRATCTHTSPPPSAAEKGGGRAGTLRVHDRCRSSHPSCRRPGSPERVVRCPLGRPFTRVRTRPPGRHVRDGRRCRYPGARGWGRRRSGRCMQRPLQQHLPSRDHLRGDRACRSVHRGARGRGVSPGTVANEQVAPRRSRISGNLAESLWSYDLSSSPFLPSRSRVTTAPRRRRMLVGRCLSRPCRRAYEMKRVEIWQVPDGWC